MSSIRYENPLLYAFQDYTHKAQGIISSADMEALEKYITPNGIPCSQYIRDQLENIRMASSYEMLIHELQVLKTVIKGCEDAFMPARYRMLLINIDQLNDILKKRRKLGGKRRKSKRHSRKK